MGQRITRHRLAILLATIFSIVAGQAFAYPLNCSMPVVEMSFSELVDSAPNVKSMTAMTMPAEMSGDSVYTLDNCEQICGYCLSYSLTAPAVLSPLSVKYSSLRLDYYQSFLPSAYLNNLFRPPKPV